MKNFESKHIKHDKALETSKKGFLFTPDTYIFLLRYGTLIFVLFMCYTILADMINTGRYDIGIIAVNIFAVAIIGLLEFLVWAGAPMFIKGSEYEPR